MSTLRFSLSFAFIAAVGCSGGGGSKAATASTFTISGSARAAAAVAADGDTKDPNASLEPNFDPTTAQLLPSVVTVGGHASATDAFDWYRATLAAGQTVTLKIADWTGTGTPPDLDLYVLSDPQTIVSSSALTFATESVTMAAGQYFIVVHAAEGESNYVLTLGQAGAAAADVGGAADADDLDPTADFVPGDVIVRFRDDVAGPAAADSLEARAAAVGLSPRLGGPGREMLMELGKGATHARALDALGLAPIDAAAAATFDALELEKRDTVRAVRALRRRADVAAADLNYIVRAAFVPNDPYYPMQWDLPLINLPQAWDVALATATSQVVVAVVDTGILSSHPDLAGKIQPGYDFISDSVSARDGNGPDTDPTDTGDSLTPGQSSFHGSHVAGTIAGATDNGAGVAGVSDAMILPVRVLGANGGTSFDILQGVRWAAGLIDVAGRPAAGGLPRAQVINLSLGCTSCFQQTAQDVYDAVRAKGVMVVAASGNNNSSAPFYPASYGNVISVAAVDMNLQRAPYSNFGPHVDIAAPGGDTSKDLDSNGYVDGILSTVGDDSMAPLKYIYKFLQGTSMASPHVAGVLALMTSVCPTITPAQVDTLIANGTLTGRGSAARDDFQGHGVVDALAGVQAAITGCSGPPQTPLASIDATPTRVDFGTATAAATVVIAKRGTGALGAVTAQVSPGAPWLSVALTGGTGGGLGTYAFSVNRAAVSNGTGAYSGTVTFTDGTASMAVPVTMQVGAAAPAVGNAGYIYVILVSTTPDVNGQLPTVAQAQGDPTSGAYTFSFTNVPAGSYYLIAGSDSDDDGFVCDPGESCGAYPTIGTPTAISTGAIPVAADFTVGFDVAFGASAGASALQPRGFQLLRRMRTAGALP